jgi:hypothetical protein
MVINVLYYQLLMICKNAEQLKQSSANVKTR